MNHTNKSILLSHPYLSLLENDAKVNVYNTSVLFVDKNVPQMPISDAKNMPYHGAHRDRS